MGYITAALDAVSLADGLRREKGVEGKPGETGGGLFARKRLAPYIYENLYLPIVQKGVISLEGLDISRVTEDDVEELGNVFATDSAHTYVSMANRIISLHPAAVTTSNFI